MKILIASDAYYPPNVSGVAYFSHRLAKQLARDGNRVYVVAPSRGLRNEIYRQDGVTVYGVTSIPVPTVKGFRVSLVPLIRSIVGRIVGRIKPDVIHVQNHFMIGKVAVEIAKKNGIPVIGTNHFMPENLVHYFHLPKTAERGLIRFGWRQFVRVYNKVDYVTSPTKTAADLLDEIGFVKKVKPISCGIDLERFTPKNRGDYLMRIYNVPQRVPILLYVGRLDKEKNVDVVIRSLPKILKVQKIHFVIAGSGNIREKLQDLVRKMKLSHHVTFTGFVSDVDLPNLYAVADIFVAPGGAELQCISALEAVATGLPLVAADAVALPELVKDGKNGFLFVPGNCNSLADKIIKILSNKDLAERMGRESLRIAQKHDIKISVSEFETLYRRAIALRYQKEYRSSNLKTR